VTDRAGEAQPAQSSRPPGPAPELVVLPDLAQAAAAAAERFARRCVRVVADRGECAIALAGGDTPRALYARLAFEPLRSRIPWSQVRVFWGDERGVPPQDPRSNFRMAQEALLSRLPIPDHRIHRMPAERADAEAAAEEYAAVLREHLPAAADGWPQLDLVLLGLGEDGHTASLFPGAPVLRETRRLVVAYPVPHLGMSRMTLTLPVLNHAAEVMFLVSGAQKAQALWAVLEGPRDPDRVPAQGIRPVAGAVVWIVDAAAASRLTRSSKG
jgi:6-phosphogluconolactonase